jgi:hypothetical protein
MNNFFIFYFSNGVRLSPLGTAAIAGLLCQLRMMIVECEALGENLPQCRFVYHKSHMACPRFEPRPQWEASD